MSENEVATLSRKLDDITKLVMEMSERLKDLPEIKATVGAHDRKILVMEVENKQCRTNCKAIQEAKKGSQIDWRSVKSTVVGTVVAGIIMLALGIWIGKFV